MVAGVMILSYV